MLEKLLVSMRNDLDRTLEERHFFDEAIRLCRLVERGQSSPSQRIRLEELLVTLGITARPEVVVR